MTEANIGTILYTIAPVFLLLLAGFGSVKSGLLNDTVMDGIMAFAVKVGIPCFLFLATASIDFSTAYNWQAMGAFYGAAALSFACAAWVSRHYFGNRPGEAVATGFAALFSNLVLMGLPITERALGEETLQIAVALVSLHAPFCYLLGISAMEAVRADGRGLQQTIRVIGRTLFKNSLMVGIVSGFVVNLTQLELPGPLLDSLSMLRQAALPAALFALGGILTRYRLSDDLRHAGVLAAFSLVVHPLLVLMACTVLNVETSVRNVVVLMATMAPGLNSYLFANMYTRGEAVAANTVLLSTMMSVLSISVWLMVLLRGWV